MAVNFSDIFGDALEDSPEYPMAWNIKSARIDRRMSQEDLAERAKVSLSCIRAIEDSKHRPSMETFLSIVEALQVSADSLLEGEMSAEYKRPPTFEEMLKGISEHDAAMIRKAVDAMLEQAKTEQEKR